jgi:hypothetical protein
MVIMLRLCCLIIGFVIPSFCGAQDIHSNEPVRTKNQSSMPLTSILEGVVRGAELPAMPTSKRAAQRSRDWHSDLVIWLSLQQRTSAFDNTVNQLMMTAMKLLKFETYRIGDSRENLSIAPFSSTQFPVLQQLPAVSLQTEVTLKLNVPPSPKARYLAITTQSGHTVYLNQSPLTALDKSSTYCLDNHLYQLPAIKPGDQLSVTVNANMGHRSITARVVDDFPRQRNRFYDDLTKAQGLKKPDWFSVLWSTYHEDEEQIRGLRPWLQTQISTNAPWRYAYILFRQDGLEQWLPKFDTLPTRPTDLEWWRALHLEAGVRAIRTGRLSTTYKRIQTLGQATDLKSRRARTVLTAALLDDAGLSAKAAQLLAPFDDTIDLLRQRQTYLANAELLTQSAAVLAKIAASPSRSRNDVYAWLSDLYRSGKVDAFQDARNLALQQCASCWRIFGVLGGDVLPPLGADSITTLAERPGLAPFKRLLTLPPPNQIGRAPVSVQTDDFFDTPMSPPKVQSNAPIRNIRLDQHINISASGLSSVRVRRRVRVFDNLEKSTVSFTLDYVPDRQFIIIQRAILKRKGEADMAPVETDESTDQPSARLYYDSRRRRLAFSNLKPGDIIELDWSVVDHSSDSELPGLDGWVFPINQPWPTDESSISWHSDKAPIIAQLSHSEHPLEATSVHHKHLRHTQGRPEKAQEFLMLSLLQSWTRLDTLYQSAIQARYAPTPFLATVARDIIGSERDPRKQLALLFYAVQQNVHYVGLELGEHSRTPEWAENVWRRGLGDCKDKAALLIALAKTIDIQLEFALIRTRLLPKLTHGLATLALFDHAAVYAPQWKRYLDANQPNLGLEVLPALVQGAQAHIVGDGKGLQDIPISKVDTEHVDWRLEHRDPLSGTWNATLTLKGHASGKIIEYSSLDDTGSERLLQYLTSSIPGWIIESARITKHHLASSTVRLKLQVTPISSDKNIQLRTLIQTSTAWYNQAKPQLFNLHDLPRSFGMTIPMRDGWTMKGRSVMEVPGGRISLKRVTMGKALYLRLDARLTDPSRFTALENEGLIAQILARVRGAK